MLVDQQQQLELQLKETYPVITLRLTIYISQCYSNGGHTPRMEELDNKHRNGRSFVTWMLLYQRQQFELQWKQTCLVTLPSATVG